MWYSTRTPAAATVMTPRSPRSHEKNPSVELPHRCRVPPRFELCPQLTQPLQTHRCPGLTRQDHSLGGHLATTVRSTLMHMGGGQVNKDIRPLAIELRSK